MAPDGVLLGNASEVVPLKVHAHLRPGDDERARSVVDAALDVVRTGRGLADEAWSRLRRSDDP